MLVACGRAGGRVRAWIGGSRLENEEGEYDRKERKKKKFFFKSFFSVRSGSGLA